MKFLDYIQGLRKGKEAHRIEHDAMTDPFLSDAIDGYDAAEGGNHAKRIADMQARVTARASSARRTSGTWKIAVAAVVFIALVGGYFGLMNHESAMLVAHGTDNSYITIYAPDEYIDRKNLELTELIEAGQEPDIHMSAVVDIVNLHEVIKPVKRIDIYMPEVYYAQLSKKEAEELSAAEERMRKETLPAQSVPSAVVLFAEEAQVLSDVEQYRDAPLIVEKAAPAHIERRDANVSELLQGKAAGVQITENRQNEAVLSPRITAVESPLASSASGKKTLTGKVVDKNNEPLIGVSVFAKGTNTGTVTDIDGNYRITVDSAADTDLIAQYLGYETIEIPEPKDNQLIAMSESHLLLDEVVVT